MSDLVPVRDDKVRVVARPHPFREERLELAFPPGPNLVEILAAAQPDPELARRAHIFVDGRPVPSQDWAATRPAAGQAVAIRAVPGGFLAGIFVAIAAAVATKAATAFFTWMGLGVLAPLLGGLVGAAVGFLGSMLVSALIAPPQPPKPHGLRQEPTTMWISGARNVENQYGIVPRPLGTIRMTPPLAAKYMTDIAGAQAGGAVVKGTVGSNCRYSYRTEYPTESSSDAVWFGGDEQYLRMLVCWGYGPLDLEDIKVGNTPLEDYEEVEVQHFQGYSHDPPLDIYSNDVYEDSFSTKIEQSGDWYERQSAEADELSVDITLPDGLIKFTAEGAKTNLSVTLQFQYRPVGATSWISLGQRSVTAKRMSAMRQCLRWVVPRGQYEVAVKRITEDFDEKKNCRGSTYWTALRAVKYEPPVRAQGMAMTALRIRASDQLHGVIDTLNGVVTTIARDWDKAASTWVLRATNNPASIFRLVLQNHPDNASGPNAKPVPDDRLDLDNLQYWHEFCEAKGYTFGWVVDWESTVAEILTLVAGAGRASPTVRDGKYGVIIDEPMATPVQHFTPRNSWDFKAERHYVEQPHGLRVRFPNELKDYEEDERLVFADGYDENNAALYETLELVGATHPDHVYRLGRYFMAAGQLRRETYSFMADLEHLVCERGDLIRTSHDVTLWGLAWGRIKEVLLNDLGQPAGLVLDEQVTMIEGYSYGVRIRAADGTSLTKNVVTLAGDTHNLYFDSPITSGTYPAADDLVMFGEQGTETADLIVKGIEPQEDLTARITCVDYDAAVYTADTEAIPEFDSNITIPSDWHTPTISDIQSGGEWLFRAADGSLQSQMVVFIGGFSDLRSEYVAIEAFFRLYDPDAEGYLESGWAVVTAAIAERQVRLTPVEDGETYAIKVRYVRPDGGRGPWSETVYHQVEGKSAPPNTVTGFSVIQRGSTLQFVWDPVPDLDVAWYEIRYSEPGLSWEAMYSLTQAGGNSTTTALVQVGTWTFAIKAVDFYGNYSEGADTVQMAVAKVYYLLRQSVSPPWTGEASHLIYNPLTHHLNWEDQDDASADDFEVFDNYVVNPYSEASYIPEELSLEASGKVAVVILDSIAAGPGENLVQAVRRYLSWGDYTGQYDYEDQPWGVASEVTGQFFLGKFKAQATDGALIFKGFSIWLEAAPLTVVVEAAIGASGTVVDLGDSFLAPPSITVSAQAASGVARIASYEDITRTSVKVYVYDAAGTKQAGTATVVAQSKDVEAAPGYFLRPYPAGAVVGGVDPAIIMG